MLKELIRMKLLKTIQSNQFAYLSNLTLRTFAFSVTDMKLTSAKNAKQRKMKVKSFELKWITFAKLLATCLHVFRLRFQSDASTRQSVIDAQIKETVPLTVDMCMSALYAKLRNINKSYGRING